MNNENEVLAELATLKRMVRRLTVLTAVMIVGALSSIAIYFLGIDGVFAVIVYTVIALTVVATTVFGFLKACKFRDQQMKNQKRERGDRPSDKI